MSYILEIKHDITEEDISEINEIFYEALGEECGDAFKVGRFLMDTLPRHFLYKGLTWGFSDTVFKDDVYEFLIKQEHTQ